MQAAQLPRHSREQARVVGLHVQTPKSAASCVPRCAVSTFASPVASHERSGPPARSVQRRSPATSERCEHQRRAGSRSRTQQQLRCRQSGAGPQGECWVRAAAAAAAGGRRQRDEKAVLARPARPAPAPRPPPPPPTHTHTHTPTHPTPTPPVPVQGNCMVCFESVWVCYCEWQVAGAVRRAARMPPMAAVALSAVNMPCPRRPLVLLPHSARPAAAVVIRS